MPYQRQESKSKDIFCLSLCLLLASRIFCFLTTIPIPLSPTMVGVDAVMPAAKVGSGKVHKGLAAMTQQKP